MKTKVYFSIPVSIDWDILVNCVERLQDRYDIRYWGRGQNSYNRDWIRTCDVFIIMLPKCKWNGELDTLPSGVKNELKQALRMGIPIYLAYKPATGIFEFYDTSINTFGEGFITGIPGTSGKLYERFEPAKMYPKVVIHETPYDHLMNIKKTVVPTSYDRRILLAHC